MPVPVAQIFVATSPLLFTPVARVPEICHGRDHSHADAGSMIHINGVRLIADPVMTHGIPLLALIKSLAGKRFHHGKLSASRASKNSTSHLVPSMVAAKSAGVLPPSSGLGCRNQRRASTCVMPYARTIRVANCRETCGMAGS